MADLATRLLERLASSTHWQRPPKRIPFLVQYWIECEQAQAHESLKQVFTNEGRVIDWFDPKQAEGRWFLEPATQVKNIWGPYGG